MLTYRTEFVQTNQLRGDDIIIAFMGQTGSGKSRIIGTLIGEPGRRTTESLISDTQDLEAVRILDHERYESRIVLVETPGFNHSKKSDEDTLKLIHEWLEKTCEKRILPSGMVYVERINDPTCQTSGNYLRMFAKLTCPGSAKSVVLTTTMWDMLGSRIDDGNQREERLKKYWEGINHHDANVERFLNDPGSAWSIVDNLVKKNDSDSTWSIVDNVVEKNDQKEAHSGKAKGVFPGRSLVIWILGGLLPKSFKKSRNKPRLLLANHA